MMQPSILKQHDIELEVKNVPLEYGWLVRKEIKSLQLHTKLVAVSREDSFHQFGSARMKKLKDDFEGKVSI